MADFEVDPKGRIKDTRESKNKKFASTSSSQYANAASDTDSAHSVSPARARYGTGKTALGIAFFFAAVIALQLSVLMILKLARKGSLAEVEREGLITETRKSEIESQLRMYRPGNLGAREDLGYIDLPGFPKMASSSSGPKESMNLLGICDKPDYLPSGEPLLEQTVKAWEVAGARYCWLDVYGRYHEEPSLGAKPGFIFEFWKRGMLDGLPEPATSFFLDLSGTKITDVELGQLQRFKQLTNLNVSKTDVSDAGLGELTNLNQLTSLELSRTNVYGSGIKALARLEKLTTLGLGFSKISDEGLRDIGLLKNLKVLSLGHYLQIGKSFNAEDFTAISNRGLRHLATLEHLEALCLLGTGVDDEGLKALVVLKKLKTLSLSLTKVTAGGIKTLAELENLASLVLSSDLQDADARDLSQLKKLRRLQLIGDYITDSTLHKLSESGLLHSLSRAQTDDGQRPKGKLEVVNLDLSGTRVSNNCIELLKDFQNLQTIDLRVQRVTYRELKELVKKNYDDELDYDYTTLRSEVPDEKIAEMLEGPYRHIVSRGITSAGIKQLLELNHLMEIRFEQRQLDDSMLSLFCLKGKLHLLNQATSGNARRPMTDSEIVRLDLRGSSAGRACISSVEQSLPNCKVLVDGDPQGESLQK